MKNHFLFPLSVITFFLFFSCQKKCDCTQSWVDDCNLVYYSGDLVSHNGVCYKAFTQGKACSVEPGTTQGDIWEVCK